MDSFVKSFLKKQPSEAKAIQEKCIPVLDAISSKFSSNDSLLGSVGMISIYYLVFRRALKEGWENKIQRTVFGSFEKVLKENRELASEGEDDPNVDLELLEFSRLSQSPNDAAAIRYRVDVLAEFIKTHYKIESKN